MNSILGIRKIVVVAALILAVVGITSGCSSASADEIKPVTIAETLAPVMKPLRIGIMTDKSGSTMSTRTPQLTMSDIDIIINTLELTGGELAVGEICAISNASLVRLRMPEPVAETPAGPQPTNVFERHNYNNARAKLQGERAAQRGQADANLVARIGEFKRQIAPLLARDADCVRTDVAGALIRLSLYLRESTDGAGWRHRPVQSAVVITDGIHTAKRIPIAFDADAELVVVNGSATLGVLARLNPKQFESVEAALHHVTRSQKTENNNAAP